MDDYFAPDAPFTDNFCRHFRMCKHVFDRLYHGVWSFDDYFIFKKDAMGRIGLCDYHKCTTALWMLAYGAAAISWDEYLRMSESTCRDAMVRFASVVVEVFGPQYMRESTVADIERLLAISKARGWPDILVLKTIRYVSAINSLSRVTLSQNESREQNFIGKRRE
ncbi:uncharacterized protein [Aegilops tauschii subsp. strangulata]|uniref:uncharacterized protein n=1 Tax=Aegilops tauschii subsp. strangulata TaxID=200361 RepID=UPI003CC86EDB